MNHTKDDYRKTSGHDQRFEATLLRAQFDANKHVTSLAKATQLLKDGEELYFINQATSHEVKLRNEWWGANER